jgi:hypothetical protein
MQANLTACCTPKAGESLARFCLEAGTAFDDGVAKVRQQAESCLDRKVISERAGECHIASHSLIATLMHTTHGVSDFLTAWRNTDASPSGVRNKWRARHKAVTEPIFLKEMKHKHPLIGACSGDTKADLKTCSAALVRKLAKSSGGN